MYRGDRITVPEREEFYRELDSQLRGLLQGERDFTANLANSASLIFYQMQEVNWVGFYLYRDGELVVGPFQGKPACTRIPLGGGVCGTSAETRESLIVEDVHQFPGHIACDEDSRSELVIPMLRDGELLGVFDLDSPVVGRFDEEDERQLRRLLQRIIDGSD